MTTHAVTTGADGAGDTGPTRVRSDSSHLAKIPTMRKETQ